jgi:hypothetical protein
MSPDVSVNRPPVSIPGIDRRTHQARRLYDIAASTSSTCATRALKLNCACWLLLSVS